MWLKTARRAWSRLVQLRRLISSFLIVEMTLSQAALSYAPPRRPMLATRPDSRNVAPKASEVYCEPRTLSCLSSADVGGEEVGLAGDVALEAADGLVLGESFGFAAGGGGRDARAEAEAADRGEVECA